MNIRCAASDCAWNDKALCKFPIGLIGDRGVCQGYDHEQPNPAIWQAPGELHCTNEFCVNQDRNRSLCSSPEPKFNEKAECMIFKMKQKSELLLLQEMVEKIAKISKSTLLETEQTQAYLVNGMRALEKEKTFPADATRDIYRIMQNINASIGAFIGKYSDLLDVLAATRKKEEEILAQLTSYLSRYV